jgi:hypothetical protein
MSPDQRTTTTVVRTKEQHLTCVRVRSTRFGMQVVTVVPADDQPEIVDWCERRRTGPDDTSHRATSYREETAVAFGGTELRGQDDVVPSSENLGTRGIESRHVAMVWYDEHRSATTRESRCRGLGQTPWPVLPRQCGPHRTRRVSAIQGVEERSSRLVLAPGRYVDWLGGRRWSRDLLGGLGFHPRVTRWNGEPYDVGPRPGVPVGDQSSQPCDVWCQDRLGGDDPTQR